ncbi:hypothetical protein HKCCE2091_20200, partial [Rhodobacterales bacterium HKCCE2091]|nr:hypothetical protein [Rhodobacterales bacterium HKCCE2091]
MLKGSVIGFAWGAMISAVIAVVLALGSARPVPPGPAPQMPPLADAGTEDETAPVAGGDEVAEAADAAETVPLSWRSEFNRPPPETRAALPETDPVRETAAPAPLPQGPSAPAAAPADAGSDVPQPTGLATIDAPAAVTPPDAGGVAVAGETGPAAPAAPGEPGRPAADAAPGVNLAA